MRKYEKVERIFKSGDVFYLKNYLNEKSVNDFVKIALFKDNLKGVDSVTVDSYIMGIESFESNIVEYEEIITINIHHEKTTNHFEIIDGRLTNHIYYHY